MAKKYNWRLKPLSSLHEFNNRQKIKLPKNKVEVKAESLEKLKCCECNGYLSCGPVFQTEDGKTTCGRCPKPKALAFHIISYEHLAEKLYFPCPNAELGCKEKILFSEQKTHDVKCDFRPLICVIEASSCKWTGPRSEVPEHCETKHPGKVLQNPGCLKNNFNKDAIQTFLMSAFTVMFLIHTKICLTTKKFMISISQLGEPENGSLFSFQLDIEKNKEKITKLGSVIPQSEATEPIPENTATSIHINSIVDIFGNLDGVTFTITIHTKCATCMSGLKQAIFHENKGWFCTDCVPIKRSCKYNSKGCVYSDFDKKSIKHEYHFCKYSTWCWICRKDIFFFFLDNHRKLEHSSITYDASTTWSGIVNNNWQHCIVVSEIGNLLCSHWMNSSGFQFRVSSPLSTVQLETYNCTMILSNPATQNSVCKVANVIYDDTYDWLVEIDKDEFLSFVNNEEFDVKIQVIKRPTFT